MTEREQELTALLAQARSQIETLRQENALLRQKVDLLVRRIFGSSSEQLDPAQLHLFLQVPQPDATPAVPPAAAPVPRSSSAPRPENMCRRKHRNDLASNSVRARSSGCARNWRQRDVTRR